MPAGLRRYWASRRRGNRRSNPHRRHRRNRARTHTIVRYRARRSNRRIRRYRNPGLSNFVGGMSGTDLLYMGGGALVNGILARAIPQMVPMLSSSNHGIMGYGMNVVAGAAGAWGIGKFNRRAGQGAWIGMIVAVGQRIIADNFGSGGAAATGGMSGDMDFDLGYYTSDRFPYPQGTGGPYDAFPGSPYLAAGPFPATSAAAVRAGAAAAAAALPAAGGSVGAATSLPGAPQADRWGSVWT